jgi:hypothetical protein
LVIARRIVEAVLIIYYMHIAIYGRALLTKGLYISNAWMRVEGTYSLYCSGSSRGEGSLHGGSFPSFGVGGGEVRGLISLTVTAGVAGIDCIQNVLVDLCWASLQGC